MAAAKGLFRLPIPWTGYVATALLLAVGYLYPLLDARAHPWILWERSWMQDSGDADQRRLGRYTTQDDCLKEQWKKLKEELELQKQVQEPFDKIKLFGRRVHLVEGRTIFEFGPSLLSRMAAKKQTTPSQDDRLMQELLLPEIVSTVSFFCAPSLRYGFWPYYAPTYYASADDLRRLGEKTLAARAQEMLEE